MGYKFNPFTGNLDVVDTTAAAGSTTEVQFNSNGVLDGSADLTWDDTGKVLGVGGDIDLDDGGTYTTTLQTITPTAARTISFPDATGTVGLVGGSSGNLVVNQSGAYAGVANSSVDNATGNVTLGSRFISTYAATASAPAVSITGAWRAGSNADSLANLYVSPGPASAGTAWSTAGTGIGVNAAAAFAGDLLHLMINGTSEWKWSNTTFTFGDANDIAVGTTTGTKIGTATTQKLGFYNAAPVVQPAAVADITTTATSGSLPTPDGSVTIADATTPTVTELLEYCVELEAKLEAALGHLRTLGLIAT